MINILDQTIVVSLRNLNLQTGVCAHDEVLQLVQAVEDLILYCPFWVLDCCFFCLSCFFSSTFFFVILPVDYVIQLVLFERPAPTLDGIQKSLKAEMSKVQR